MTTIVMNGFWNAKKSLGRLSTFSHDTFSHDPVER